MKKMLTILLIMLTLTSLGQIVDTCGTVPSTDEQMLQNPWYYNNSYLDIMDEAKEKLINTQTAKRANTDIASVINPVSIPIRFWIYHDASNNTPLPNNRQLQTTIDQLNFLYQSNNMNVRFYALCNQFIDDPDALIVKPFEAFNKLSDQHDQTAINVHIVDDYEGAGAVYNSVSDFIVVEQSVYRNINSVSTLAHEIGHYFGLDHTHRNSDKKKCRQESINRNTTFEYKHIFCLLGGPKFGRVCEKNGDALCDTPADPNLLSKTSNCFYNPANTEMDEWDDVYTNNTVNTNNIMSYAPRGCRDYFSSGQIGVMWNRIFFTQTRDDYIYHLNANFMDPDQYEPDDSDFSDVPRIIEVGETQYHSFHGFEDCADIVDWLRIENNEIGNLTVEIGSVEDFENRVAEVNIYNTDASGNRAAKYGTISSGEGSIQIPCSTSTNDFLVEVIKAEDPEDEIVQSIYTVTLSAAPHVTLSNMDKTEICISDRFEILNLPQGATVSWSSSSSITLQVNSDQSVRIANVVNDSFYQIIAEINYNGCKKEISKTFESTNSSNLQAFEIVEVEPACYPAISALDYGVYKTEPPTKVKWSIDSGNILGNNIGTSISVKLSFGPFNLTATSLNECANELTVTKIFFADECNFCSLGLSVVSNSNKTIKLEIDDQSQNFRSGDPQDILITDINYNIIDQMTTNNSIVNINTSDYKVGIYLFHVYAVGCHQVKPIFIDNIDNCNSNCSCAAHISDAQLNPKTIKVAQKIISNNFNNAEITYIAGESILLQTGFETHRYFDFEAKIEDCQ